MNDQPAKPAASEQRYRANLQGEVNGAQLYRSLADAEPDPKIAEVYRRLAGVEEAHGEFWRRKLQALGKRASNMRPGWRTRALGWLAHRFGPEFVLPVISGLEKADVGNYDAQPDAVAGGLPQAERSHARILAAIAGGPKGGLSGATLGRIEGRHRTGGNALRAAVLGANDGLVSNLSLVMGVAGASFSQQTVLVTGLAGLVAGACSMAMGEWLSVTSSRELYQKQIATEADELALVREEIGVNPDDLGGSAWSAALSSFSVFMLGAIFPVVPFFFLGGNAAVASSLALSAVALYGIGAITSIFTGRSAVRTGLRQVAVGVAAAAVTYGLGRLLGVSLS